MKMSVYNERCLCVQEFEWSLLVFLRLLVGKGHDSTSVGAVWR